MSLLVLNAAGLACVVWLLRSFAGRSFGEVTFVHAFSAVWGFLLLGCQVMSDGFYRPYFETILVMYAAWLAFLAGAILGVGRRKDPPLQVHLSRSTAVMAMWGLVFLHAVFVVVNAAETRVLLSILADPSRVVDVLATARLDEVFSDRHAGWFFEFFRNASVYYLPLAVLLYSQKWIGKGSAAFVLGFALVVSLGGFSRIPLLLAFVATVVPIMVIYRPSWRRISLRWAASLALLAAVFVGIQIELFRRDQIYSGGQSVLEQVGQYAWAPARAYEMMVVGKYPVAAKGLYSLEAAYYFAGKVGLLDIRGYPEWRREFVGVPYQTNVYTLLDAFTLDFGPFGAILGTGVLGWGAGLVYRRVSRVPDYFGMVLYSLVFFCCATSSLANMFIKILIPIHIVVPLAVAWVITRSRDATFRGAGSVLLDVEESVGEAAG